MTSSETPKEYKTWAEVPFGGQLVADENAQRPKLGIKRPRLSIRMHGQPLVMPYNYIPFFKAAATDADLGEHDAPGRDAWLPSHYSGEIRLIWRAERPLIIAELGGENVVTFIEEGRNVKRDVARYDVPRDHHRLPRVSGTTTRGPLRNLFAAVTGSRLDVSPTDERLTYSTYDRILRRSVRHTYPKSPAELVLPRDLLPPAIPEKMSAVQRVFGTVQESATPFERASLVEFGDMECLTRVALPDPGPAWTLAIQGQPKPTYGRFTLVRTDGTTMAGVRKEDLFQQGHQLAGRGIWLHHSATPGDPPPQGWRPGHGGRPYLAGADASYSQVVQITGWIPPGTEFEQRVTFTNLSPLELGALLWLIDRPTYHHVGRMRGFGFGSVSVARGEATVFTGQGKRTGLLSLRPTGGACSEDDLTRLVDDFDTWLAAASPAVRRSVLVASQPFEGVRYPTLTEYAETENTQNPPARPPLSQGVQHARR